MRPTILIIVFLMIAAVEPRATPQTQADMSETARVEYTSADAELNREYQQILQARKADLEFVLKFKAAQRAWIVYRDADVQALFPAADKRRAYGSVYPMCRWQVLSELTRERTKQLKAWTEPPAEGDTCAGSRAP
ncbi:MAG TPA: lysozyme inhibitor LprI family protein [Vicinamibacterales bacterium]